MRGIFVILAASTLAACAAKPRAQLAFIDAKKPNIRNQIDSYAFPRTFVDIKQSNDDSIASIVARNQTFEDFRVGVATKDDLLVRTNLGLTKVANSDLLDEIGVDTKDNRVALIGDVGKLAIGLLPLVGMAATSSTCTSASASPGTPLEFPLSLDSLLALQLCRVDRSGLGDATDKQNWRQLDGLTVWFGPLPPDAMPVRSGTPPTYASLNSERYKHGIVYAACRELRISFTANKIDEKKDPSTGKSARTLTPTGVLRSVYISDPRYFRYVGLPFKGKVKIHPQCGTSVITDGSSQPSTDLAIANAFLEQGKAFSDALKKSEDK